MAKRLLPVLILLALFLPAALVACSPSKEKEIDMLTTTTIPRIDVDAPTKTETATFASG